MKTPAIKIPKEEADAEYKKYLEACKKSGNLHLMSLKQAYFHLARGRKLLDIYEVFHQAGVNAEGEPPLAIALATSRVVTLRKDNKGAGVFMGDNKRSWRFTKNDIALPESTWSDWKKETTKEGWTRVVRREIQTHVPLVPAEHMPSGSLQDYFILWEVDNWQERIAPVPRMGDPYLLKRINNNTFVVMAEWDVTPVEQAILRGI